MNKTNVPISRSFISLAEAKARANGLSLSEQIEFWAKLGKSVEENRELSLAFIEGVRILENQVE